MRFIDLLFMLAAHSQPAAPSELEIHTSCATALAEHETAMRDEVARTLDHAETHSAVDVSLLGVTEMSIGAEVEVVAEVQVIVSDGGILRWTSRARAAVRGTPGSHSELEREAVIDATHELATAVRSHL
jgi:hypothetical protein